MNLCHSIRLNCWQQIKANSSREANAQVLRAAYNDYKGQVSPWLSIIIDTSRSESQIVKQARNRAAECLSSLAGGFICVADFDSAQTLSVEALQLVFDNGKLEAEIKSQLDLIASEMSKFGPHAAASAGAPRVPHTRSREPQPGTRSVFSALRNSRVRLSVVVAVGIALLIAIPATFQVAAGPEWYPSITDLVFGRPGANVQPHKQIQPMPLPMPRTLELQRFPSAPTFDPLGRLPVSAEDFFTPRSDLPTAPSSEVPRQAVSLPNGTDLIPPGDSEGLGQLKISNYTDHDAAVKLKTSVGRTTVRFVYVQSMRDLPVPNIVPGEYVLQFATGRDWDGINVGFRQDRAFATFDKVLSFSERQAEDGTVYSTHEVTLHAVPNGNLRKKPISADEFSDDLGVYH